MMSKKIFCTKLKAELEALPMQPLPGPLGEKIHQSISKKAWQAWLSHQTMLINEYRLNLMDAKAKAFLHEEMEKFFFGEPSAPPPGFVPKKPDNS